MRASSSFPRTCSGDMYATVPTAVPGLVRSAAIYRRRLSPVVERPVCELVGRCGANLLGQAEIENFGVAALGDENIRRLDIAMDDSFGVCGIESIGNFDAEIQEAIRDRAAGLRSGA